MLLASTILVDLALLAFTVVDMQNGATAGVVLVDDPARTGELRMMIGRWAIVLFIVFLWSFSYTIWPRREKTPNVQV